MPKLSNKKLSRKKIYKSKRLPRSNKRKFRSRKIIRKHNKKINRRLHGGNKLNPNGGMIKGVYFDGILDLHSVSKVDKENENYNYRYIPSVEFNRNVFLVQNRTNNGPVGESEWQTHGILFPTNSQKNGEGFYFEKTYIGNSFVESYNTTRYEINKNIGDLTSGDFIICTYEIQDGNLFLSTINANNSSFNMDKKLLTDALSIVDCPNNRCIINIKPPKVLPKGYEEPYWYTKKKANKRN
jgi:hypothetical protein